jgi:hypothetical protein
VEHVANVACLQENEMVGRAAIFSSKNGQLVKMRGIRQLCHGYMYIPAEQKFFMLW